MSKKDQKTEQKSLLNTECSRRNFLRGSAAVAAGLALGGLATSCATRPQAAAQLDPLLLELNEIALRFMRSPVNDMGFPQREPFYDDPLFGVASGADPLWNEYKKATVIGDFHWTPREVFLLGFPQETGVRPEELSVLSWILPQTQATRQENRRAKFMGSERWVRNRRFAEPEINNGLRNLIVAELAARNIQAVAPITLPDFSWGEYSEIFVFAPKWSERHAAYAAGLGTFSLSDGLITPAGKAHRAGSVVLRARMEPSVRPYTSHKQYCLYFKDGSCGMCIDRCPVGSIRVDGRDKRVCRTHLHGTIPPNVEKNWGFQGYGCGLCQTGVPCESRIPPGIVV